MTHSSKILAALLLMFTLVGCGQSGKLYLPGDPSEVQSLPTTISVPAEEEDDEAADDDGGT